MRTKNVNFVGNQNFFSMDIQLEKSLLLKRFEQINDIELIKALNSMLDFALPRLKSKDVPREIEEKKTDWWDVLPEHVKAGIEEGLAESERGEGIDHGEVMEMVKERFLTK